MSIDEARARSAAEVLAAARLPSAAPGSSNHRRTSADIARFDRHDVAADEATAASANPARDEAKQSAGSDQLAPDAQALSALNEFASRLWRRPALQEGLDEVLRAVVDLMRADFGTVQLLDDTGQLLRVVAHRGFEHRLLHHFDGVSIHDESACASALRTRRRILIEDVDCDSAFEAMRPIAHQVGFESAQYTPLIGRNDEPLGVLSTQWCRPHRHDVHALGRLDLYTRHAIDFVERLRMEEGLRLRESLMTGQREALEAAINDVPLEESLGILVRSAIMCVGSEARAAFYLANDERTALHHVVGMGPEYAKAVDGFTVGPDSLACGLATYSGTPIITRDVRTEPLWQPWLWMAERFDYRACWSFPVRSPRSSFFGTLAIYWRAPRDATSRDIEFCRLIAHAASLIVSRHREMQARKEVERTLAAELTSMTRLHELSLELVLREDVEQVLHEVMLAGSRFLGADRCTAQLVERDPGSELVLRLVASAGFGWEFSDAFRTVDRTGCSTCAAALARREAVLVGDLESSEEFVQFASIARHLGIRSAMSFPLKGSDGDILGVFTAYWDRPRRPDPHQLRMLDLFLQQGARQIERRAAEAALKDADRRKDEFLATLAHELRNPLAPLRNGLHLLRSAGSDPHSVERVRTLMERQVHHMVRLVDDLMEVSRITRGKIDLRKERVDLAAVVQSAVETSTPLIESSGHRLTVVFPGEPLQLEADPVRLAQVVTNLLNNAAKYTGRGGEISLSVSRLESRAVVSIRDSGIGIPPGMISRIFDMFTQVDGADGRCNGGLGIGLTLAKHLVTLHGGSIEARSEGLQRGSEFVVSLPLAMQPESLAEAPGHSSPDDSLATLRILVVDDHRDAAESLTLLLRCLGADVRTTDNGADALRLIEDYSPAVALLDIGMPGMNGFEVARRARRERAGRDAVLIALTGWGQEGDRRRSREAGFDHHLVKPVDLAALQALLLPLATTSRENVRHDVSPLADTAREPSPPESA